MQLPFDLNDVRLITLDGPVIRFILPAGHVEILLDTREAALRGTPRSSGSAQQHVMFEDGIYGI